MSNHLGFSDFKSTSIPNPTVADAVQWMCKLANKDKVRDDIRGLAERICAGVQSGDYASEALSIYLYVWRHVRYMRDIDGVEFVRWSKETLDSGCGDCDDMSVTIASLMMSTGAQCEFVLASFTPDGTPSHVFVRVVTPFGYMVLDPVANIETGQMLRQMTGFTVVRCEEGVTMPAALAGIPFHGWKGWK